MRGIDKLLYIAGKKIQPLEFLKLINELNPKAINGFVKLDNLIINLDRLIKYMEGKPKVVPIYNNKNKTLGILESDLVRYNPEKPISNLIKKGKYPELLSANVVPEIGSRGRSVPNILKNKLKNFLESSYYRKKLKQANISEKILDELINHLHDTKVLALHLSNDTKGISYNGNNIIGLNTFHPNKNVWETTYHELTHSYGHPIISKTRQLKRNLNPDKIYKNKKSELYGQQLEAHNRDVLINNMPKNYTETVNFLYNSSNNKKTREDIKNWLNTYYLTPEEMRAKLRPIQIAGYSMGWSPKQTARFMKNFNTYDTDLLYKLYGEDGMTNLITNILKNGGRL